jgi:lipopolysaccharide/colanic/teichoic acid biosynthesis glycosyltransferase
MKRSLDLLLSLGGVLVLLPIGLMIALAIKGESTGPVFYRGVRAGRFGKPFRIFKFRTMVVNADKIGGPSSAADDPRITRVGGFLRRYKLDELPQLINIFKGEMSFVGPRPEVLQYVAMFSAEEKAILSVPPGITDWASIANPDEGARLAGSPDPEKTYLEKIRPEKIRLQLEYVRRRSFGTDMKILLETLKVLMFRQKSMARIETRPRGGQ